MTARTNPYLPLDETNSGFGDDDEFTRSYYDLEKGRLRREESTENWPPEENSPRQNPRSLEFRESSRSTNQGADDIRRYRRSLFAMAVVVAILSIACIAVGVLLLSCKSNYQQLFSCVNEAYRKNNLAKCGKLFA